MADKSDKSSKKSGLTLALIILGVLVIFIIFLIKKDSILTNLKETRFFERVFGSTPEFVENHKPSEKDEVKIPLNDDGQVVINVAPKVKEEKKPEEAKNSTSAETKKEEAAKETEKQTEKATEKATDKEAAKPVQKSTVELQLCFVEIDPDGSIIRKMVGRTVAKNDSPLTAAINLVLQGPDSTKSAERNCTSLIPAGTKLLGARVKDGIAYLDFNENFEINPNGVEGYNGQLMQLVYTATTFSTVNSVQFLIEGQKKEYLGSEGQWIGSPLSRNSF